MSRLITFANLYDAKRDGSLVEWLREMTSAQRVEAAECCAANSRRTVSEWLATFGDLMDGRDIAPGAPVRVTSPTAPDFGLSGTAYPQPSGAYAVSFGPYWRPYGRDEIEPVTVWPPAEDDDWAAPAGTSLDFAAHWDRMAEVQRLCRQLNECAAALMRCIAEGRPGMTEVLTRAHNDLTASIRAMGFDIVAGRSDLYRVVDVTPRKAA